MPLLRTSVAIVLLTVLTAAVYAVPWLAIAQSIPQPVPHGTEPVYVGLIEDDRRELTRLAEGIPGPDPVPNRNITPYFVRDPSGWKPVQQLNQKIKWTIAFDGKNLGEVESEPIPAPQARPKGVWGPLCVHSILTPLSKGSIVGKAEGDPRGTFNGNYGVAVRRPFVVVSKRNFSDPDHWKRSKLPDEVMGQVRLAFRGKFSHVRQCDASGEPLKHDFSVPDSEIVVVKAYGSNKGAFVVETQLKNHHCVFNMNGPELQLLEGDQWFYASPSNDVFHLGRDWNLIDAGDYDGDGKSEIIFYIAESEDDCCVATEGYILFWDDFQRNVRFTWSEK